MAALENLKALLKDAQAKRDFTEIERIWKEIHNTKAALATGHQPPPVEETPIKGTGELARYSKLFVKR